MGVVLEGRAFQLTNKESQFLLMGLVDSRIFVAEGRFTRIGVVAFHDMPEVAKHTRKQLVIKQLSIISGALFHRHTQFR
ncbi:MAG: hypothetical protein BAJALOKI1v1_1190004 [Promethearchaeota archaeon]|nr:MAG: hypothetical protein BAJALOKI1v1_1190004 [Candidatus Lokiarchaeota archaeon]